MISKNVIILILAAALAAVILFTCNCRKVVAPVVIPGKEQVKAIEKKEAETSPLVDSMNVAIEMLKSDNVNLAIDLKEAQAKNRTLSSKASVILDTITVKDNDYYSNRQALDELIANNAMADSLCNVNIENLNGQIDDYIKVINLKDTLNYQIRQSFNTAIAQQNILQGYSKKLERKVKWTQAGKWLWKGAALLGGLFIIKTAISRH